MDVQGQCLAAQLREECRAIVLEAIVQQDSSLLYTIRRESQVEASHHLKRSFPTRRLCPRARTCCR
eukprot:12625667-Prorocentrum_lima.AAC.1